MVSLFWGGLKMRSGSSRLPSKPSSLIEKALDGMDETSEGGFVYCVASGLLDVDLSKGAEGISSINTDKLSALVKFSRGKIYDGLVIMEMEEEARSLPSGTKHMHVCPYTKGNHEKFTDDMKDIIKVLKQNGV